MHRCNLNCKLMQMYRAIRKELEAGGRAYIICPLVDESSSEIMAGIKAAEEEHRHLQQTGVLGGAKCGLLHGRMSSEDKFAALQAFASGETPVLISTTVVEVCLLFLPVLSITASPQQSVKAPMLSWARLCTQGRCESSFPQSHNVAFAFSCSPDRISRF